MSDLEALYYHRERGNLEIVGTVEDDEPYQFDIFMVFKNNETGKLYYASDCGCSCPSPFERMDAEECLEITKESFGEFSNALWDWLNYDSSGEYGHDWSALKHGTERVRLMAKVAEVLSGRDS